MDDLHKPFGHEAVVKIFYDTRSSSLAHFFAQGWITHQSHQIVSNIVNAGAIFYGPWGLKDNLAFFSKTRFFTHNYFTHDDFLRNVGQKGSFTMHQRIEHAHGLDADDWFRTCASFH